MKLLKILGFATVLGAAALCSPLAGAFTSGGWQGQANHDDDGTFRDCTMTANFANGITLSVEQALAGSDTVGRASYRLARGLSLDLKGGSVNGIELVYRTFFGN